MRTALVSLALLLLVAGSAQASVTIMAVKAPVTPIQPEIETAPMAVIVTVGCNELFPFGGRLEYTFRERLGVIITGPTSHEVQPCATPQGSVEVVNEFMVAITRDVPGLEQLPGEVKVHLITSQFVLPIGEPGTSAEAPFALAADAYFLSEARAIQKIVDCPCGGGQVPVPIIVTNHGNVRTVYDFEVVDVVSNSSDGRIVLPSKLILESPNTGLTPTNETVTAVIEVPASGQVAYTIKVTQAAADAPDRVGDPVFVNVLVRNSGSSEVPDEAKSAIANVPGLGPLAVLGILGLALVAARRRA